MIILTNHGGLLITGKHRLVSGANEITQEELWELRKSSLFVKCMDMGILTVPPGTVLDKPKANIRSEVDGEQEEGETRLKVREILELIRNSDDIEYIKELSDGDDRQTVLDVAANRIKALTKLSQ